MDIPLEILDADIARAHAGLVVARARLAHSPNEPNPLTRAAMSRRATYEALADRADRDTLLGLAVRSWVSALTLERVVWPDTLRLAAAWREPSIPVRESGKTHGPTSARDLLVAILAESAPVRRSILADALARGASHVQDAARIRAERRAEAVRLLAMKVPVSKADAELAPLDAEKAATRLLADTAALVPPTESWADTFAMGVGRDASEGWPARLGPRWLMDLFQQGPLTEGLRLALEPLPAFVRTPPANAPLIGASSFARALGAFGAALAEADGASGPWCIAHAPFDVRVRRRAALFASLAADPVFATTRLGLGRDRARDQARKVAHALLIALRVDAARVLAQGVLVMPAGERASRFEEVTAAAFVAPIPTSLAGVVPRLGP
jgi:hypothetical protein